MRSQNNDFEKVVLAQATVVSLENSSSDASDTPLTARSLAEVTPPHESYEGYSYWDPAYSWTSAEERKLVRKVDLSLLSVL